MAFESKQGISDLEKFCLELDEEERRKREKAQKKRDKKSKQKLNRSNRMMNNKDEDSRVSPPPASTSPPPPAPARVAPPANKVSKCPKAQLANSKAAVSQGKNPVMDTVKCHKPVTAILPLPTSQPADAGSREKAKRGIISARTKPLPQEVPSLESMLKDDVVKSDNEENFIPLEDIRAFQARFPVVDRQREELRRNLRQRFNQLCVNGL